MERKKRSRNLDLANGNPLSALDALVKDQAATMQPMQPDEFTVDDYIDKLKDQGVKIGFSKAVRTMNDLMDIGTITARKGNQNGKQRNLYRFV